MPWGSRIPSGQDPARVALPILDLQAVSASAPDAEGARPHRAARSGYQHRPWQPGLGPQRAEVQQGGHRRSGQAGAGWRGPAVGAARADGHRAGHPADRLTARCELRPVGTTGWRAREACHAGRLNRPRSWRCTFLPRAALSPTSTEAVRRADETVTSPESGRQSRRPDEPLAVMIDTGVNTTASQMAPAVVDLEARGDRHDCRVRRMSFISSTKCRSSVGLGSNSGTRCR